MMLGTREQKVVHEGDLLATFGKRADFSYVSDVIPKTVSAACCAGQEMIFQEELIQHFCGQRSEGRVDNGC